MTQPTLFAMNGSRGLVGGEAGDEAILPLETLWSKMKTVVAGVMDKSQDKKVKKDTKSVKEAFASNKSKSGTTYNRYETHMNIDISSVDSLKKLKKLLDDLETAPEEPAMA